MAETDVTFGFDTALGIATEAIDRLHSTAHSHHRIIVVEIMGHHAGWLALGAGIAGGADVILIPEIPYDIKKVAEAIRDRSAAGQALQHRRRGRGRHVRRGGRGHANGGKAGRGGQEKGQGGGRGRADAAGRQHVGNTMRLTTQLEQLTGLESRVTILGYLQRGGTPSAADRLLATRLGTAARNASLTTIMASWWRRAARAPSRSRWKRSRAS